MIQNYIKNIVLIGFALIGPIYLPAGGIQRNLNQYAKFSRSREIVLGSDSSVYCIPSIYSNKIRCANAGTSLSILNYWVNANNERWMRVKLSDNIFFHNPRQPLKGWMKV